jgi:hypothetical protein
METQARIARLEAQVRWLALALSALLLTAGVFVAVGAAPSKADAVRTERLELVNGDGDVRAVLKINERGAAYLELRDGQGNFYLKSSGYKDQGGTLYMTGDKNKTFLNATANEGSIDLTLYTDRPRATMSLDKKEGALLLLNNNQGEPVFRKVAE